MRRLYLVLLFLLLCTSITYAGKDETMMDIRLTADGIKARQIALYENSTNYDIMREIDQWVEYHMDYDFRRQPRGINIAWSQKKGDCTDKAMISAYMGRHLGIETRMVTGYIPFRVIGYANGAHDWFEFKSENGSWENVEGSYMTVVKTRNGFWGDSWMKRIKNGLIY